MLSSPSEQLREINRPLPDTDEEKENRRIQRISLPLPARVEVKVEGNVGWNEITRLSDVSAFGVGFNLKRPIKRGRVVLLTMPMPRQLRSFDYSEPQYKVWGIVRRCISVGESVRNPEYAIGVAFTGKTPPPGHLENPSMLYDISKRGGEGFWQLTVANLVEDDPELPKDQRKQTRFHIPEVLKLEVTDDKGNVIGSENTVSENVSLGGAAVFTSLNPPVGSFVRVTSERFDITILSVIRNTRVAADGITRLHLEFIDQFFPLEGIE